MQAKKTITWYDSFSRIYDLMSDYPYKVPRKDAIDALKLQEGDVVLDLFCGTGINFQSLAEQIGETGKVIAIDASAGMLEKAKDRINKLQLNPDQFELYEQDLLNLDTQFLTNVTPPGIIPKVLQTLGVAGHTDWNSFWDTLFKTMPGGTRFVTMDVSCPQGSLSARIITLLGAGEFSTAIADFQAWLRLKERCSNYGEKEYDAFNLLRCTVVVASGMKAEY